MTDKKQNQDKPSQHKGSKTKPLNRTLWSIIAAFLLFSTYVFSIGPTSRLAMNLSNPEPTFRVFNIIYYPIMWIVDRNEWLFNCLVAYQGWWLNL